VRLVEGYYNAGEIEKANKLAKELMVIHSDKVRYFNSFKGKRSGVKSDIDDNIQIMSYIQQVAQMNRQEALSKEFLQEVTAAQNGQ
jgi:hypothetical protein